MVSVSPDVAGAASSCDNLESADDSLLLEEAAMQDVFNSESYDSRTPVTFEKHSDGLWYATNGTTTSSHGLTDAQHNQVMSMADANGDGKITDGEFMSFSSKAQKQVQTNTSIMSLISETLGKIGDALLAAAK